MKTYGSFQEAIRNAKFEIYKNSQIVAPKTWQSIDVTKRPEMVTHELQWWGFTVPLPIFGTGVHAHYQKDIEPNLPWADDHFEERVCGYPLNPGTEWANWPWASSADKFRKDEMFNHSYAERYWPKLAMQLGSARTVSEMAHSHDHLSDVIIGPNKGIRYDYGDLGDVVNQMVKDPNTRQAVLPVFFPEDTGAVHGDRVPCSIHYHFMIRNGKLDIFYYLRSCDFVRHFRDDIYLTLRLQLWVIDQLKAKGVDVVPGNFRMFIGSLHLFKNDWRTLYGEEYKEKGR
jgi:thymidylate synthase-like protein